MYIDKFKKILSFTFIVIIIVCINNKVYSQVYNDNLKKYWFYRNNLKYFVVNGNPSIKGMNLVAGIRNKGGYEKIDYGQPMTYFGYYLGVLATEWYLLNQNGQYSDNTLTELNNALDSYIRLDECEDKEPWNLSTAKYDGFFMREDVPYDFVFHYGDNLNKGLTAGNVFNSSGDMGYVSQVLSYDTEPYDPNSNIMSQDEAIGLLMGLALVSKFLPFDSYAATTARTIASKVVLYIRNDDESHGPNHWRIYKPDGVQVTDDWGGVCWQYAYGFAKAAQFITTQPLTIFYDDDGDGYEKGKGYRTFWDYQQFSAGGGNAHAHMVATLAAIGNSWTFSGINSTGNGLWSVTEQYEWHPFYLLLWKVLHSENNDNFLYPALSQLIGAPCKTPYLYDKDNKTSSYGWASSAKYWHTLEEQHGNSDGQMAFLGLYNGLDYMLLYNMYHIAMTELEETPIGFPSYINYMDREVTGNIPNTVIINEPPAALIIFTVSNAEYNAFDKITSDMYITNEDQFDIPQTPGHVVFKAGTEIDLKPGFTVENGATFDGIIQSFTCSSLNKSMDTTNNLYDFVINQYDSIFAPYYYTPYSESYVAEAEMLKNSKIEPPKKDTVKFNNYDIFSIAAYPNPFNNTTTIEYNIPYSSDVNISIFDIYGIKIMQPVSSKLEKGEYSNVVNMSNVSKGIYYCKLSSGNQTKTIKLVLSD